MIVFYFFSTFTGFLISSRFGMHASVGSSAGIFGLIGAMLAFGVFDKSSMGQTVKALYMRWLVYLIVLSFIPGVDFRAHIGGLSGGFVAAWLASTPRARTMWKEPLLRGLAGVSVLLTALAFVLMFISMTANRTG
jgi:rhomboid protease GluP